MCSDDCFWVDFWLPTEIFFFSLRLLNDATMSQSKIPRPCMAMAMGMGVGAGVGTLHYFWFITKLQKTGFWPPPRPPGNLSPPPPLNSTLPPCIWTKPKYGLTWRAWWPVVVVCRKTPDMEVATLSLKKPKRIWWIGPRRRLWSTSLLLKSDHTLDIIIIKNYKHLFTCCHHLDKCVKRTQLKVKTRPATRGRLTNIYSTCAACSIAHSWFIVL